MKIKILPIFYSIIFTINIFARDICYVCCFNDGVCNDSVTYETKACCNANCDRDCSEVEAVGRYCLVRGKGCNVIEPSFGIFARRQPRQTAERELSPVQAEINPEQVQGQENQQQNFEYTIPDLNSVTRQRLELNENSETIY